MNLYVDGCFNKNTNGEGWASVCNNIEKDMIESYYFVCLEDLPFKVVKTPKGLKCIIIAQFNDVSTQQNNGAELLAFMAALRIAKYINCNKGDNFIGPPIKKIYSDSQLLVQWWSKGMINKKTKQKMDQKKLMYIYECAALRSDFEKEGGIIEFVSGDNNIADLGYHK